MIELSTDQQALQSLGRALRAEADGKALRRDLARQLRAALQPATAQVRSGLMGMATAGVPVVGAPLRTTVLRQLKAEARLSGRATGARLRIKKKGMPRGFTNAPKRLNSTKGWRHPVRGGDTWVKQLGAPEYFDRPLRRHRGEYRDAVLAAMNDTARRITRRI